jgi:hypothetical protein
MAEGTKKKRLTFIGSTKKEKILGIFAIMLLFLVVGRNSLVLPAWERWKITRERIDQQEELYRRYLDIYNQKDDVERIYKSNQETIERIEEKIFRGNDIHVASAKLQKAVETLAESNNIYIRRTHNEKPVEISGGLYVITLGVFGEVRTMVDLNRFLEGLEFHKDKFLYAPRLYIKNIRNKVSLEIQVFGIAMIEAGAIPLRYEQEAMPARLNRPAGPTTGLQAEGRQRAGREAGQPGRTTRGNRGRGDKRQAIGNRQ